jgi:NOL1/NOP2/sun family putative RNA methylase
MNIPQKFLDTMKELLGSEYTSYEESFQEPKAYGLRVNTAKISVEEFLALTPFALTPVPWTENGFYYREEDAVTKHPHYYAGLYYIQEPSAMIPASRLPIEEGDRVLDLCAAPGGKATELGARLHGTGVLVANDISNSRAKGLLKNLELFGIGNMLVTSETPEKLLRYFTGYFDKILIDAPCSGEGMFRRDPSMVRSWEEHGPEYYSQIQREIVITAEKLLRPGGKMLYSTCTFSTLENEGTIRYLLEECPDLSLIPARWQEGFSKGELEGCIRVFPHKVKGEGHFAALLEKEEADTKDSRPGKDKKKKLPPELEDFLKKIPKLSESMHHIEIREERAYLLPGELPSIRGLRFLRTGLYLGDCKKNRFEPSQALAMWLSMEDYPDHLSFSSEDERVLRYLKGESIFLSEKEAAGRKGWILVGVDGYPLGWGKIAGETLKNKYYPGWRLQ